MGLEDSDVSEVLAANLSFYEAFGSLDIDRMDKVWGVAHVVSTCVSCGGKAIGPLHDCSGAARRKSVTTLAPTPRHSLNAAHA